MLLRANSTSISDVQPPPPKRKKRKVSEDLLRSKVARYEEQLRDLGVSVDQREETQERRETTAISSSHSSPRQMPGLVNLERRKEASTLRVGEGALLVDGGGKSRYVDNNLWMTINDELPNQRPLLQDQQDGSTEDELDSEDHNPNFILFGLTSSVDVLSFYPRLDHIMALWQAYKENVDPLTKVIHRPTIDKLMILSCQNIHAISKANITLLFAIHHIAVESLSDEQVTAITGESKATIFNRMGHATQICLTKCGVLRSSDLTVLVAMVLYVQALRAKKDAQTISTLMSVVLTMCQRIGLHRDITTGLRPFDIEMRRRVWKNTLILDWICSEVAGLTPFLHMYPAWWSCPNPRNLNDEDFDTNTSMNQMPESRTEPTEMIVCQMRYNFGKMFIGDPRRMAQDHGHLLNSGVSEPFEFIGADLTSRDKAIDDLERLLQDRFLRYADPIDPVHNLVSIVARSAVVSMRIRAHHPRQYTDAGASLPAKEHEKLFSWSLQSVQYDNLFFTTPSLARFAWHSRQLFQYHPVIYLLTAIRSKRVYAGTNSIEMAWIAMDTLYNNRSELLEGKHVLHIAIAMLAVKAWEVYDADQQRKGKISAMPAFIGRIRAMTDAAGIPRHKRRKSHSMSMTSSTRSPMAQDPNIASTHSQLVTGVSGTSDFVWDSSQWAGSVWSAPPAANVWNNWDQLFVNPDIPVDASFDQNTFQVLDGFFAPIQDPPRSR